jgi:hypothetical protein
MAMAEPTIRLGTVRERPGFSPAGDLIQFVDVTYTIAETGSSGLVSIPKAQFSAELAQRLVKAQVDELWKLHNAFSQE